MSMLNSWDKNTGTYTCQTCGSLFTCLKIYQQHVSQHAEANGTKLFCCNRCTYSTDSSFQYNWHQMSHKNTPWHTCSVCKDKSLESVQCAGAKVKQEPYAKPEESEEDEDEDEDESESDEAEDESESEEDDETETEDESEEDEDEDESESDEDESEDEEESDEDESEDEESDIDESEEDESDLDESEEDETDTEESEEDESDIDESEEDESDSEVSEEDEGDDAEKNKNEESDAEKNKEDERDAGKGKGEESDAGKGKDGEETGVEKKNEEKAKEEDEPQADEQILEIKKQTLELQKQTLELEKLTVELKKRFEMNTKGRAKVPSAPSVTSVPSVSSVPSVPSVPSAPSAPLAPSILATEKNTASDGLKTGAGSTVLKNAEEVSKKFPKNDGKNLKDQLKALTTEQISALLARFLDKQYLSPTEEEKLAKELNVGGEVVKAWFTLVHTGSHGFEKRREVQRLSTRILNLTSKYVELMKKDFGVDLDENNGLAQMIDKFEFDGEVVEAWRERNHAQHNHPIKVVATDAMKADASSTQPKKAEEASSHSASNITGHSDRNQLGVPPVNRQPMPENIRQAIIDMAKDGIRPCDICRRLRVSHAEVSKVLGKFYETGIVDPNPVEPEETETEKIIQKIIQYKRERPSIFSWEIRDRLISENICKNGKIPSVSSINRYLRNWANEQENLSSQNSKPLLSTTQMLNGAKNISDLSKADLLKRIQLQKSDQIQQIQRMQQLRTQQLQRYQKNLQIHRMQYQRFQQLRATVKTTATNNLKNGGAYSESLEDQESSQQQDQTCGHANDSSNNANESHTKDNQQNRQASTSSQQLLPNHTTGHILSDAKSTGDQSSDQSSDSTLDHLAATTSTQPNAEESATLTTTDNLNLDDSCSGSLSEIDESWVEMEKTDEEVSMEKSSTDSTDPQADDPEQTSGGDSENCLLM